MASSRKSAESKSIETIAEDAKSRSPGGAKSREARTRSKGAAVAQSKQLSAQKIAEEITALGINLNRQLGELQQQVIEKLSVLEKIDIAINAKQDELQSVFDKEVVLTELEELLERLDEAKQRHEAELSRQNDELAELRTDGERRREQAEEDFKYEMQKRRRDQESELDWSGREAKAKLNDELEDHRRAWRNREADLVAREHELIKLRAQAASFDQEVERRVQAQVGAAVNNAKRDATNQSADRITDLESQLALAEQRRESATSQFDDLRAQVAKLQGQLEAANERMVTVATSGFGSLAGQQTISALQNGRAQSELAKGKAS